MIVSKMKHDRLSRRGSKTGLVIMHLQNMPLIFCIMNIFLKIVGLNYYFLLLL